MAYTVTLIPGDGTGPELAEATRRVLEATGVPFNWDVQHAGFDMVKSAGTPLPASVLDSIRRNKVAIKGPITTPVGAGFRSVNLSLLAELDLYACLRPCKSRKGVRSRYDNVDLVVVRENTEDLYAGIEFKQGDPNVEQLSHLVEGSGQKTFRPDSGISIKPISVSATRRIVTFAFDYARTNKRRKVTAATKATVMKYTDGLFVEVARDVAKEYPEVEYEEMLVDNLCVQLVQKPELYDVLVLPNLYGDIVSDLCAGLVGGPGVAPGVNFGDGVALFEPAHGSAPRYAGMNKVNPTGMILSGLLMLQYLKETDAAERLETAVSAVLAEGKSVTYDMKLDRNDLTAVGASQMADAIIARLTG